MTIEELYKWAIKNDCENKQVVILAHDNIGNKVENWLDEDYLEYHNKCISVNCRWE